MNILDTLRVFVSFFLVIFWGFVAYAVWNVWPSVERLPQKNSVYDYPFRGGLLEEDSAHREELLDLVAREEWYALNRWVANYIESLYAQKEDYLFTRNNASSFFLSGEIFCELCRDFPDEYFHPLPALLLIQDRAILEYFQNTFQVQWDVPFRYTIADAPLSTTMWLPSFLSAYTESSFLEEFITVLPSSDARVLCADEEGSMRDCGSFEELLQRYGIGENLSLWLKERLGY